MLRLLAARLVVPQLQGAAEGARRETLPQKIPPAPLTPSILLDDKNGKVYLRAGCQVTLLTPAANGLVCGPCSHVVVASLKLSSTLGSPTQIAGSDTTMRAETLWP